MREDIEALLRRTNGAASRQLLTLQGVPRGGLDHELRAGKLVRAFPRSYVRPWDIDVPEQLERAAFFGVGAPVAVSHLSALRRWGILEPPAEIHLTVPYQRALRPQPGLVVHRARRFPRVVSIDGIVTVAVADALVTSWPLLPPQQRRGPILVAQRESLVTRSDLTEALARYPKLAGRRELLALAALLDAGCESELELWGMLHVFNVRGLDHGVRQHVVRTRSARYRLDLAYELEKVAIEMDGEAFHSSPGQRERDRRRDAALASLGWLTLRYSYRRLHEDVAGCRRETLAVLASRRSL